MKISIMTNKDKSFYPMLGPFLANRAVEKEIGFAIYDDGDKEWVVAAQPKGVVIGFCYRQAKKGRLHIGSCYVVPKNRGKNLFRSLLQGAVKDYSGKVTLTASGDAMKAILVAEVFVPTATRGKFVTFEREYSNGI